MHYFLKKSRATNKFQGSKQIDSSAALTASGKEKIPARFAEPFGKAAGKPPN